MEERILGEIQHIMEPLEKSVGMIPVVVCSTVPHTVGMVNIQYVTIDP